MKTNIAPINGTKTNKDPTLLQATSQSNPGSPFANSWPGPAICSTVSSDYRSPRGSFKLAIILAAAGTRGRVRVIRNDSAAIRAVGRLVAAIVGFEAGRRSRSLLLEMSFESGLQLENGLRPTGLSLLFPSAEA